MADPVRQNDITYTVVLEIPGGGKVDLGPAQDMSGGGIERTSSGVRAAGTGKQVRLPGLPVPGTITLTYLNTGQDIELLQKATRATGTKRTHDYDGNITKTVPFAGTCDGVTDPVANVDDPTASTFQVMIAPNEK